MVVYGHLHNTLPHYHHYADLSEGIELLKHLSDIFFRECVSKIRSVFSIIFHAIYGAVCIQLTHFFYDDCENICTRSYYHHQIGSMTHLPLFRIRSWNNVMRCMSFYILMSLLSDFNITGYWSVLINEMISGWNTNVAEIIVGSTMRSQRSWLNFVYLLGQMYSNGV